MKVLTFMLILAHASVAVAMPATQRAARPSGAAGQSGCVRAECHADVRQYAVVHGPVGVNACDACHESVDVEAHTFRLTRAKAELCTYCHESNLQAMPVVHKPAALGECLGCHDPHGGSNAYLLRERTVAETCNRCHEPITHGRSVLHTPIAQGACESCHPPHASRFPKLLDAVGPDLCLACHGDFEARVTKVKLTHKALAKGCEHCHDPHGSNQPMATTQPVREQCGGCHAKVLELASTTAFKHTPMSDDRSCMNCHTPHGSSGTKLVKDSPAKLCANCHAKDIKSVDGKLLAAAMPDLSGRGQAHGAMRDGECAGCHASHGGQQSALLTKFYSTAFYQRFARDRYALCFSCHDAKLAEQPEATPQVTKFRNGPQNLHFVHVTLQSERGENCRVCHDVHLGDVASGNDRRVRDRVRYGTWEMPVRYTKTGTGGSCYPGCHPRYDYDRDRPVENRRQARPSPRLARTAGGEVPARVELSGQDVLGQSVRVPDPQRATVILIVQAGQEESRAALAELKPPSTADTQVIVIARGIARGEEFLSRHYATLADPDGAISARLEVHGWPTALVIDRHGNELSRVGGTAACMATKLQAYTDLVAGRVDAATARQAATRPTIVGDSGVERAAALSRAARQAEALLAANRVVEAKALVERLVAADPKSSRPHYLLGRALELQGDHPGAAREYRTALDLSAGR